MNCPYCNKELISGFISGGGYGVRKGIIWLPQNIEPTLEAWVF
nr:PF20097 family protein [Tissierella carlieri]